MEGMGKRGKTENIESRKLKVKFVIFPSKWSLYRRM